MSIFNNISGLLGRVGQGIQGAYSNYMETETPRNNQNPVSQQPINNNQRQDSALDSNQVNLSRQSAEQDGAYPSQGKPSANDIIEGGYEESMNTPPPVTAPQSDYQKMMAQFGEHWQQDDAGMEDIMNRVAFHETGPHERYAADIAQQGGGPGRGLFQFETGAAGGGMTARNRLANWYTRSKDRGGYGGTRADIPEWLNQANMGEQGFDASQLSPEQQKMMFLATTRFNPNPQATLKGVSGDNLTDFWQDHHYAGKKDKSKIFGESMEAYISPEEYMGRLPVDETMDNYNNTEDIYNQPN